LNAFGRTTPSATALPHIWDPAVVGSIASVGLPPTLIQEYEGEYNRISEILDDCPQILDAVHEDLKELGKPQGWGSTYGAEQFLRTILVRAIEAAPYRDSVVRVTHSEFLRGFVRIGAGKVLEHTRLSKATKCIEPSTCELMNGMLFQYGRDREHTAAFRDAQRFRAGCEGSISVLQRAFGLRRCLWKGFYGFAACVGCLVHTTSCCSRARCSEAVTKARCLMREKLADEKASLLSRPCRLGMHKTMVSPSTIDGLGGCAAVVICQPRGNRQLAAETIHSSHEIGYNFLHRSRSKQCIFGPLPHLQEPGHVVTHDFHYLHAFLIPNDFPRQPSMDYVPVI
jgi:hypothetical protein